MQEESRVFCLHWKELLKHKQINNLFILRFVFKTMVNLNFETGDYVKIRLALDEIEGRILESFDKGIYLLKLNNGYNIGINKTIGIITVILIVLFILLESVAYFFLPNVGNLF